MPHGPGQRQNGRAGDGVAESHTSGPLATILGSQFQTEPLEDGPGQEDQSPSTNKRYFVQKQDCYFGGRKLYSLNLKTNSNSTRVPTS